MVHLKPGPVVSLQGPLHVSAEPRLEPAVPRDCPCLSHSWHSWDLLSELFNVSEGFPSRALLVAATQPSFGIVPFSQRPFLGASLGHGPTCRHTHLLLLSFWTLLPDQMGRGGQERGSQIAGNRPWCTYSTPLLFLDQDPDCQGNPQRSTPPLLLEERHLPSQNMSKMEL